MTKYLLDSDTITALEDTESPVHQKVFDRFYSLTNNDMVCFSIVSLYEYQYSIANAPQDIVERLKATKKTLLNNFEFLPLTVRGSEIYGELKKVFKTQTGINTKGIKKHNIDFIIASTAIENNAVLVSIDKGFEIVQKINPALQLQDWTR